MSYYNPHYVRIPFSPNIWTWIHSPFKISMVVLGNETYSPQNLRPSPCLDKKSMTLD